jgi:DNA repair exonuclease SbcCD ATPase subunit
MLLRRLRLTAFRQFAAADLELSDGITLITGANGAGKSTLIEGIVWTMFGGGAARRSEHTLPSLQLPHGSTRAELELEIAGTRHILARSLQQPPAESRADVPRGLVLPGRDVFMRACVTGRRELQALAQLGPAARTDTLARLLHGARAPRGQERAVRPTGTGVMAAALRTLEEELESAERRMATLASAPDLLAQYTAELDRARTELAQVEQHADRVQDEWAQKRQDVQTRLDAHRRRGDELKLQIERLSAAGGRGACPTCDQALGSGIERVIGRLDDEFYITTQDVKWLAQRRAQLERRPPDVAEAETRRDRLRALVADRAERVARCEQAVQELWSVAQEQQRAQERLAELRLRAPAQLSSADVASVSTWAAAIVAGITDGHYEAVELTEDGRVYGVHRGVRAPIVSGADEDLFALALRLAAARRVAEAAGLESLLLLDEPFGTLDDKRRRRLLEQLRALRSPAVQIIITTQYDALADCADHHIRVTRAADGLAAVR